jgi:phosphoglycerate dehydrogenase-like enzyme
MKVAFMGNPHEISRVFARGRRATIEARADVFPGVLSPADEQIREVEAIFSTWGMPLLTESQLDRMPKLRAVFYAAGAVSDFAKPLVQRGIHVCSAWQANAIPVAEFTVSQILLSCKGYFTNVSEYSAHPERGHGCSRGAGVYGESVALLGAGAIGTKVIELLRPFRLDVMAFDPFLTQERAEGLGVRKVTLETAFDQAYVVSNHLLDVDETAGLIDLKLLGSMRPGAVFLNTGRGRTVVTDDLVQILSDRPDITAMLDVTDPEPLPPHHPLWSLKNVFISSHIAGSIGDEVLRLADFAIEEFDRFSHGKSLRYQVFA